MEKVINIGGRLHNPVVGGAVTGADEIKDDTKGKTQNVINTETDAELVRLDEAKQEKLTFDQTPTENSTNPVTSGGVYAADAALQQAIEAILLLIPSAASALNQLADKSFVNSSISTATATFRGTYNLVTDLELTVSATHQQIATALASVVSTADNNDYCFVQIPVSDQSQLIRVTERYKFTGTAWSYEYDLNNSGFTAEQWAAINSGITTLLVTKLGALPTAAELATMFAGKQNTLTFDTTPVNGSANPVTSGGLYVKFAAIEAMTPSDADANNKLVAENRLAAYVATVIGALDASYNITSADGHVTFKLTQADGAITSVQVLTSDIASDAALTLLGGRVSTAEADIDALQAAYSALTQSDVVIVEGALPSSGQQQNIIYRQPDQDHTPPQFYSDYMWNGTTWVLMATYMNGIDPRPKKGSQNLVTSGGVFDNMGALDVSELNATENPHTLANYADLSAALAAIPSDYQKGGMSIKFVSSVDNKYVQYRLMSYTFNTASANWQKDFTNKEIFNKNTEETRKNGYELIGDGNYAENSDWNSSGDMYVSEDLQYETNYGGNIFCYDANGNYIDKVVSGTALLAGTTHVRINWRNTQNAPYFYSHSNALQLPIDNHAKRLEQAEKSITLIGTNIQPIKTNLNLTNKSLLNLVKNVFRNLNVENSFHIGYELTVNGGGYIPNSDYNSSGDIKIENGLQYITDYEGNIFCYGINGFIGKVVSGQPLLEGTTYIRMNWLNTQDAPYFYAFDNKVIEDFIRPNQNTEENFHVGYELGGIGSASGVYVSNEDYISSGDIYVDKDLTYDTNCTGNIFCRNASGGLGRVVAGQPLLEGTTYVRINWLNTQDAPYFYAGTSVRWPDQEKRLNNIEPRLRTAESTLNTVSRGLNPTIKEVFKNQNLEENYHVDYELIGNGSYSPNTNYISSGDIKVNDNLQYMTDYVGNIFCYSGSNEFINFVRVGNPLPAGTVYIRLNWLKTQNAPYFYTVDDKSIQELIDREYRVNGDDMLGYELQFDGTVSLNPNWRTSQFIQLEDSKNYICNKTANYYYYDENLQFLDRINTSAGTVFNKNSYVGAAFMRTNAPIGSPIEIYEVDSNNKPVIQKIIFKGYAEKVLNETESINANETIESNINIDLPKVSSSIVIRFKTNQSLYKQSETVELFRIGNVARVNLVPRELTGDSIYCDKSEVDISVIFGNTQKTIPLRLNNYGKDLFSMRIKYPIVNVAPNGLTEMVTPMPAAYEGMYIEKTDTQFIIHNGDDSVFKSWTLSNYTDIDAFVEALKVDTDVTNVFEIKKYGCEGMAFSEINNFEKIMLCKEHTEILYTQGSSEPYYTGNVYWDSYPTIIRSSDIGYEHVLKVNYRVINGVIAKAYVSLDGMFLRFNYVNLGTPNIKLTANLGGIISQVLGVSVLPYKAIMTPMLSMQHVVHVNENLENTNMTTTTMRQYDVLAYLKKKGFVGQNYDEYMASIRGSLAIDKPTYCLTFDDCQASIWRNKQIRDVFNQFRAKPTLIYLFVASDFDGNNPPSYALSTDEYKSAKASGWDIVDHGFCMYTDMLSYAQFYQGFTKNKEAWLRWYGEDVQSYNAHGREVTDFQFYLMKHMGFHSISSGSATLGWFCECGTPVEVQYKRVTWMDNEQSWESVKYNIDEWAE